ncbi:GTP-binding protein [Aliamphritea spongicola]|nr:GTP-binding protein [Aliamphritea spongicola]
MQFNAIPTNVITGFLGVGKTTAIQYLLANKPDNERWAVLVNEFGEVGIDASMMGKTLTAAYLCGKCPAAACAVRRVYPCRWR